MTPFRKAVLEVAVSTLVSLVLAVVLFFLSHAFGDQVHDRISGYLWSSLLGGSAFFLFFACLILMGKSKSAPVIIGQCLVCVGLASFGPNSSGGVLFLGNPGVALGFAYLTMIVIGVALLQAILLTLVISKVRAS